MYVPGFLLLPASEPELACSTSMNPDRGRDESTGLPKTIKYKLVKFTVGKVECSVTKKIM